MGPHLLWAAVGPLDPTRCRGRGRPTSLTIAEDISGHLDLVRVFRPLHVFTIVGLLRPGVSPSRGRPGLEPVRD